MFFAGHGLEMSGETYLVPTDRSSCAIHTVVTRRCRRLECKRKRGMPRPSSALVILNSCRDNPFIPHMTRSIGGTRGARQGLANVEPEGNVLVAYSAKHGTTALDGAGAHSPFTAALLNHIEEPGLEINFLFGKVRDEVLAKTQRKQEPFLYGSLSAEPLYFASAAGH